MKVLLAVDGSAYTRRMLAWLSARDEFLRPDTQYVVVTVVPPVPRRASFVEGTDADAWYAQQAEEVLQPVRHFVAQQQWNAAFEWRVGPPAEALAAAAADHDADLLVIGSHGRTALGNLVLGSVATSVLARCHRPVLIVR